jgi:biopolymer transport protein ExbB
MLVLKTYLDLAIFSVLGLMSFVSLALVIERFLYLRLVRLERFSSPESLEIALTKNFAMIATIAANAPYVGLLGTVLGIMVTFYDLGQASRIDTGSIMTGLALALKATALGLLAAIPSMMIYNLLTRKAEVMILAWISRRP